MKKVVLIFPDTATMDEFISQHEISNAEVNPGGHSLKAFLSEEEIVIACSEYDALILPSATEV